MNSPFSKALDIAAEIARLYVRAPDPTPILAHALPGVVWSGPGENEHCVGREALADFLRGVAKARDGASLAPVADIETKDLRLASRDGQGCVVSGVFEVGPVKSGESALDDAGSEDAGSDSKPGRARPCPVPGREPLRSGLARNARDGNPENKTRPRRVTLRVTYAFRLSGNAPKLAAVSVARAVCPRDEEFRASARESIPRRIERENRRIERLNGTIASGLKSNRDDPDHTLSVNGVVADITAQKRDRDAIEPRRDFFPGLYDTLPCGIVQYTLEPAPCFLNANGSTFGILGCAEKDLVGKFETSALAFVHPDDVEFVRTQVRGIVEDRRTRVFNHRVITPNGETRWLRVHSNAVKGVAGKDVLQAVLTDITDLERARRERNAAYENIPGGVAKIIAGRETRLVEANDNFYRMTGTAPEAWRRGRLDPVPPGDRALLRATMREKAANGSPADIEFRCLGPKGKGVIWLHMLGRCVERVGDDAVYQCVLIDVTEQKNTRIQLDRERERYRVATENSADVHFEYALKTGTITFYQNVRSGGSRDLSIKRIERFLDVAVERGVTTIEDLPLLRGALLGETSGTAELRLRDTSRDPNAPLRWFRIQSGPVYEGSKPSRVVGVIRDIDETRRLLQEREQLREIFDLELSRDYESIGRIDTASGGYVLYACGKEYYGMPPAGDFDAEMAGIMSRLAHPDDLGLCLSTLNVRAMRRALDENNGKEKTLFYRNTDAGHARWKCIRYSYFKSRSSILISERDVHDVRTARQKEENRISLLLSEVCDVVMETDMDTLRCGLWRPGGPAPDMPRENAEYEKFIRWYAARHVLDSERERFLKDMELARVLERIREDGSCNVDFAAPGPSGVSYKLWSLFLRRYDDGREYLLSYIKDVTGRVLELREREHEAEKNRQIIKDSLVAAEQASSAKSDFLSRMSHEIRTPLNAIIGMVAIAEKSLEKKEKTADCLSKIGVSSRFLLSLINDILDMSRIESGKISLADEVFDFRDFLNNLDTIFHPQAEAKGISFKTRIEGLTDDRYSGDTLRINQVLMNILSNAIKFTPRNGEVRVSVKESGRVQKHAYLRFTVRDTGIGMSRDMLDRIFEPFEQGDPAVIHHYGGSGLGLAIARNLVSLMNGYVSVNSEPGEGSVFTVELPVGLVEENEVPLPCEHGERLALVVDNDIVTAERLTLILRRQGVTASFVTSGEQALVSVREAMERGRPYDAVFVERRMAPDAPDMDGPRTAREIRAIAGTSHPAIIMTGDRESLEKAAKTPEADSLLVKPAFPTSVREAMTEALARRESPNAAPPPRTPEECDCSGRVVLLAEDNELNMEIARTLLEFKGMKVDCAENGRIAVDLFRASPVGHYDAILMDVRMPVLNGLEAAREIRGLDRPDAASVPILAMTANAFAEDMEETRSSGMNEHLAKPIETERLYDRLNAWFSKRTRERP